MLSKRSAAILEEKEEKKELTRTPFSKIRFEYFDIEREKQFREVCLKMVDTILATDEYLWECLKDRHFIKHPQPGDITKKSFPTFLNEVLALFDYDEKENRYFISKEAKENFDLDATRLGDGSLNAILVSSMNIALGVKYQDYMNESFKKATEKNEFFDSEKWVSIRNEFITGGTDGKIGSLHSEITKKVDQWIDRRIGKSFYTAERLKDKLIEWYKSIDQLNATDPDYAHIAGTIFSRLLSLPLKELNEFDKAISEVSFDESSDKKEKSLMLLHERIQQLSSAKDGADEFYVDIRATTQTTLFQLEEQIKKQSSKTASIFSKLKDTSDSKTVEQLYIIKTMISDCFRKAACNPRLIGLSRSKIQTHLINAFVANYSATMQEHLAFEGENINTPFLFLEKKSPNFLKVLKENFSEEVINKRLALEKELLPPPTLKTSFSFKKS